MYIANRVTAPVLADGGILGELRLSGGDISD